jgi:hypothetical protein
MLLTLLGEKFFLAGLKISSLVKKMIEIFVECCIIGAIFNNECIC